MHAKYFSLISVIIIVAFAVLQADSFYSDCSEDKTLINVSLTNCSQASCVADGGTFATFELTFQASKHV
ncbi:unnamed protein product [Dicrocoelium dendriticum]|nr:unnamed protein product [Dicrocoelium dendriticum]